jgi:hypothetical protein
VFVPLLAAEIDFCETFLFPGAAAAAAAVAQHARVRESPPKP